MRLWSLHPQYLDTKGLLALWREGLLAQKVLAGKTKGYRNHPQLDRFKGHPSPQKAIGRYLLEVWKEADRRGYSFELKKVKNALREAGPINVTRGQLRYEWAHLGKKLRRRDPKRFKAMKKNQPVKAHPSFRVVPGKVENWEKVQVHQQNKPMKLRRVL
jgi:hypothetical protein